MEELTLPQESTLIKPPRPLLNLLLRLRQEPPSDWRVRIEADPQLPQQREQQRVLLACNSRVIPLVHGREDIVVLLAVVVHLLDVACLEV